MGWARYVLLAALLASPAFAQAPQASQTQQPPPRYVNRCEQAMQDSAATGPDVEGYRRSSRAIAGFMRQSMVSCDHGAIFRLSPGLMPPDAPTPIFSGSRPSCPDGWQFMA